MNDLLTTLGAAIAVVATLVATAVAIEQLTLAARLRKREAWAREIATHETVPTRSSVLEEVRLRATARVVASLYVPALRFAPSVGWIAVTVVLLTGTWWSDGTQDEDLLYVVPLGLVATVIGARQCIRTYLTRERIAHEYLQAKEITPPTLDLAGTISGRRTSGEFIFAAVFAVSWCALWTGVGLLGEGRGHDKLDFTIGVVGLLGLQLPLIWLRSRTLSGTPTSADS